MSNFPFNDLSFSAGACSNVVVGYDIQILTGVAFSANNLQQKVRLGCPGSSLGPDCVCVRAGVEVRTNTFNLILSMQPNTCVRVSAPHPHLPPLPPGLVREPVLQDCNMAVPRDQTCK